MVLPVVAAAWAITILTGGTGLAFGGKGAADMVEARSTCRAAQARHEAALADHDERVALTDARIAALGMAQQAAVDAVSLRFEQWLLAHEQATRVLDRDTADSIAATQRNIERPEPVSPVLSDVLGGALKAASLGVAARAGVVQAVRQIGVASTGTAIKTLSGAAAERATLAALGGGAVAAGGGGMALGAVVLNVASIGPGVLVTGITLSSNGAKARTSAADYAALVDVAMAEMGRQAALLDGIDARTAELHAALIAMQRRAEQHLALLEAIDFDPRAHSDLFGTTLGLVKAVAELVGARVIDEEGLLHPEAAGIAVKYRTMARS